MKIAVIVITYVAACGLARAQSSLGALFRAGCDRDVRSEFHSAYHDFATRLHKAAAKRFRERFALAPRSAWLVAAALAEGATGETQKQMFRILNLSDDECIRRKFYKLAKSIGVSGDDVNVHENSVLVLKDEGVKLNQTWVNTIRDSGILEVRTAPFGKEDETIEKLGEYLGSSSVEFLNVDISDNVTSLVLDSLDLLAKWTTSFDETLVKTDAAFFDDDGAQIGTISLLRAKRKAKLAYLPPPLNVKVLELPVGVDGRFRLLLLHNIGRTTIWRTVERFPNTLIVDIFKYLRLSIIPVELAVPAFHVSSQINNMRSLLEDLGFSAPWRSSEATGGIAEPPARPHAFVQRISLSLSAEGTAAPPRGPARPGLPLAQLAVGAAAAAGRGFSATRPFVFFLVDKENNAVLTSGLVAKPLV